VREQPSATAQWCWSGRVSDAEGEHTRHELRCLSVREPCSVHAWSHEACTGTRARRRVHTCRQARARKGEVRTYTSAAPMPCEGRPAGGSGLPGQGSKVRGSPKARRVALRCVEACSAFALVLDFSFRSSFRAVRQKKRSYFQWLTAEVIHRRTCYFPLPYLLFPTSPHHTTDEGRTNFSASPSVIRHRHTTLVFSSTVIACLSVCRNFLRVEAEDPVSAQSQWATLNAYPNLGEYVPHRRVGTVWD
jgi:hypothetical protein